MHHVIRSDDIRPLVRFAGIHDTAMMNHADTWAADCRLFWFIEPVSLHVEGRRFDCGAHDLLFLPPCTCYRFEPKPHGAFYLINFDCVAEDDAPRRAIPTRPQPSAPYSSAVFTDLPQLNAPLFTTVHGIEPLLLQMTELYKNKYSYYYAELDACMTLLLARIFRSLADTDRHSRIGEIIDYVRANCEKPLTNAVIAAHFHYHPGYVSRLFLTHTGKPLHRYLAACRIELAGELLASTSLTAAEIAARTGFSSPAAFSRAFHDAMGCSPTEFRK